MTDKKHISIRKRLILLIFACWVVPLVITLVFISVSYRNGIKHKTENFLTSELQNMADSTSNHLNEAITISKSVTYDGLLEKAYKSYNNEEMDSTEFYRVSIAHLKNKFNLDQRFKMTVMFLTEQPNYLYSVTKENSSYIEEYKQNIHSQAVSFGKKDTTDVKIIIKNNRLFIVRNLYTTKGYTKFATLVTELNTALLFQGFRMGTDMGAFLMFNGDQSAVTFGESQLIEKQNKMAKDIKTKIHKNYMGIDDEVTSKFEGTHYEGYLFEKKQADYQIGASIVVDKSVVYSELTALTTLIILILSIIIPVLFYVVYFLYCQITIPINHMIIASKELEKGKLGYQIEKVVMPNMEFEYLKQSFNKMSKELKYLFEFAYAEKLARKEAKILALQSQINPHFLNNTLEMMNWQARMAGDETVSKMIEALSTLLDHSMNRKNKRLIPLSEELKCADAYLYIISMRFGQRLQVSKEIDESLLSTLVPQLILQPLLENAVKHGVETVKSGQIRLCIYEEKEHTVLKICNTGKPLTKEEEDRIQTILNTKPSQEDDTKRRSLGIRNVNERIKLIYGEQYGLQIRCEEDGETASILTIPHGTY